MKAVATTRQTPSSPRKLFYRIQEVAKMTGLKPSVLRYWESEFPNLSPSKDASDQRRYRPRDIEVILAIRKLLYEERFTIEGARKRLREQLRGQRKQTATARVESKPATAHARRISTARAKRVDRSLHRLRREVNELLEMLE